MCDRFWCAEVPGPSAPTVVTLSILSLQVESKPVEDMARKKKEAEKSPEVALLEARIRELELQNLALNTLIDVAERNGIEIRKKSGAKQ